MVKSNIGPESEQPEIPKEVLDKAATAVAIFAMLQKFSIEDATDILINLITNFLESGCKKGSEAVALGLLMDSVKFRWKAMQEIKKKIQEKKNGA